MISSWQFFVDCQPLSAFGVAVKARRNTYRSYQSLPWGLHRTYPKITPVGCPTGTIFHGENEVFLSNRNDLALL
jgi:hypothetical protein